ncbi:MAG: TrmH family RNA methyltransferase, partial [Parvularcula sp.]|nr:TrmH family RNA methyltransferase [Parvularcula sp.]
FRSDRPLALVMGAEGKGLRQGVRDHCDRLLSIPMSEAVESLNVSTAAAVALYAVTHQMPETPADSSPATNMA